MDFDNAKENIQPLASGRNAGMLQASLCQDANQELSAQRQQLEQQITNYAGDDPLEAWYEYICWIEQSYPAGGSGSGLQKVLHKCLTRFEQDERYKQDRRLITLIIKFLGNKSDAIECYQQMYNNGLGTMLADFYIAWAYSYDLGGNMRKANDIFRLGIECRAEPLEDLKEAQQHFGYTVSQRMLYSDGVEADAATQELNERRLALRSLHGQRRNNKNVMITGSVRTGAAVRSNMPGVVEQGAAPGTSRGARNAQRQMQVFNDENADVNVPAVAETAASAEADNAKSSLRSIIDAARQQENLKEPVAWHKPHKHGKIFGKQAHEPGFAIHVDEKTLPRIVNNENNLEKPIRLPATFVAKNKPQAAWVTPVTIEEKPDDKTLPSYNKCMLYPRANKEFSLEEYWAYRWLQRRDAQHEFVQSHNEWWGNGPKYNVRLYPNFARANLPQAADPAAFVKPPTVANLELPMDDIYNEAEQQEYQLEELRAVKWQENCNMTRVGAVDMEETVCLPGEQMPRRKSFFPASSISHKSMLPKAQISLVLEEEEEGEAEKEEQQPTASAAIKVWEDSASGDAVVPAASTKATVVAAPDADKENFLMPAPPARKIDIYEDEVQQPATSGAAPAAAAAAWEADETCSTQMFNVFLKSQAVSTPKAPQKQVAITSASRQFGTVLKETPPPMLPPSPLSDESPEHPAALPSTPLLRKQLSTILETSEHGTHGSSAATNTKSTLASIASCSTPSSTMATVLAQTGKSETLLGERTPATTRLQPQQHQSQAESIVAGKFDRLQLWEPDLPSAPLLKSLRFQEDKTETVTRPLMSCFVEDKTETMPKLPVGLSLADDSMLPPPPPLPPLLEYEGEQSSCGLFAASPPSQSGKRVCNQATPDLFSKSMTMGQPPVAKNSFAIFEDELLALPAPEQRSKPLDSINKLAESFITDLSFVPETQPPPVAAAAPPAAAAEVSEKFSIFLDESMPPMPPPLEPAAVVEAPATQPTAAMHLTASFMNDFTDLSKCQSPPKSNTFKTFLDESAPSKPAQDKSQASASASKSSSDYFELNAATEMFGRNVSTIKNSTLLPEECKTPAKAAPAPAPAPAPAVPIDILIDEVPDAHNDLSIYFKSTPITPKQSHRSWLESSREATPKKNYEHHKLNQTALSPLVDKQVNPFSVAVINSLLDSVEFSKYIESREDCQLEGHVKRLSPNSVLEVKGEQFKVLKMIGKGAYGSVYSGVHTASGKKVALKQEKPTNYWEYYICLELHTRLPSEQMFAAYMSIDYALVGHNCSVYISDLSEYGSLLHVCNKVKKRSNKNVDEYVVMHLSCQLLDILDHLHAVGIIHADIKPDNFLVMRPLSSDPNKLSLQLIDFGVAIDTSLFPPQQTFQYVHNDETFKCIEMRTGRNWTYQLDLYGLVGVMHAMLFGTYIQVQQRQPSGIWMPKINIPRYFNRQAWECIFRTLLNVRDCNSMPNLQELRTLLKSELAEKEKYVDMAVTKFNKILQSN
ncbi:BubR1 [Drosophila busckii]|uniref:BubR1 n=1 Tax=Drosophila busckii TaxID=30019 RepID=A0A0M3QUI3_DROBS|nr:uncharacterized protein LOC108597589 [Drosophila busckii]ALC40719.1 BubR1 [Drosophila busckii]